MGYIFTEYFYDFFKFYLDVNNALTTLIVAVLNYLSKTLPYLITYLIGYCHFYYQLGYGVLVVFYFYRRRQVKKAKNWNAFYKNSISNWVLFNISLFNKFIFNRNFIIYAWTILKKNALIIIFWFQNYNINSVFLTKLKITIMYCVNNVIMYSWTPLFKRTSYISFSTFLKRFIKRK